MECYDEGNLDALSSGLFYTDTRINGLTVYIYL